jgi:DDE superfamily endonuclease/Helix-turn-helix of DDE superfamily endonuclease
MNCKTVHSLSASRVKALFGLHPPLLAQLLFVVLPELERRRTARLESRADRKRQRVAHDGRPRTVTPLHKVLMTLLYLRHNVQHEVVGALFGFSADTAENAFHEVVPVLRDLFPAEKWDAEKQWRRNEPTWTPEAVDKVIIDSFESPVRRPSLQERQKRVYSGKKKRHTLKTQLATDQDGEILTVEAGQRGPHADLKLYEAAPLPEPIADKPRIGDTGSHSQEHPEFTTPHKKPRGGELREEQKAENKEIARQRIVVEHAIRRVKGFRILRDDYRLALGLFPMIASAVVGLIQFSRIAG